MLHRRLILGGKKGVRLNSPVRVLLCGCRQGIVEQGKESQSLWGGCCKISMRRRKAGTGEAKHKAQLGRRRRRAQGGFAESGKATQSLQDLEVEEAQRPQIAEKSTGVAKGVWWAVFTLSMGDSQK